MKSLIAKVLFLALSFSGVVYAQDSSNSQDPLPRDFFSFSVVTDSGLVFESRNLNSSNRITFNGKESSIYQIQILPDASVKFRFSALEKWNHFNSVKDFSLAIGDDQRALIDINKFTYLLNIAESSPDAVDALVKKYHRELKAWRKNNNVDKTVHPYFDSKYVDGSLSFYFEPGGKLKMGALIQDFNNRDKTLNLRFETGISVKNSKAGKCRKVFAAL